MKSTEFVIVVGRQFGSGGRKLGRRIASALGLEYYDKEVLSEAAERFGYSPEIFAQYDEKRPSPLRSLLSHSFGVADSFYTQSSLTSENIYDRQSRVIRALAEDGGGVFVGRSSDYILRDHPNMISIFLHAPIEWRGEQIAARGDAESKEKGMEIARRLDKMRHDFYNYFTGRNWGHSDNYHLSVDSSLFTEEELAELILTFIRKRFVD